MSLLLAFGAGLASGGCSIVLPLSPLASAEEPAAGARASVMTTGSLVSRTDASPLSDHLGPEDIRRAHGAMALALDPQGNGAPVSWDNAESQAGGRFTPVGAPFLKDDEICRAFLSDLRTAMDKSRLQGSACRPSGGEWSIRELKPWRQPG
jgi:surface antigen